MATEIEVVLVLGSNFGDRKANLESGLKRIVENGYSIQALSPVVESPAHLPPLSPSGWNRPYLNLVTFGTCSLDLESFYQLTKQIQSDFDKPTCSKWKPRKLDIDLLSWGGDRVCVGGKIFPDQGVFLKPYVLSPLVHVKPEWKLTGLHNKSAFDLSCSPEFSNHIPLWMGIVNVTPDSFSDGGKNFTLEAVEHSVSEMIQSGVNIIDIGAESTRPNATALASDQEWERLEQVLELVLERKRESLLSPQVSVDTYHPETAARVLTMGVDIINDVSGLRNPEMISLARESDATFIAMHNVGVPVDPAVGIDQSLSAIEVIQQWIEDGQVLWESNGLDLNRIIIDPGIGFGKGSLQGLELMRSVETMRAYGFRVLIGHSRKRFLRSFSDFTSAELDIETVGASLQMCSKSVDILRVHNVASHSRAYLSWAHLLDNTA